MTLLRRKFLHLFRRCRRDAAVPPRTGASLSDDFSERSSRNRATCDVAKHRVARSRSRCVQKARDRYDPAGHCGRGS